MDGSEGRAGGEIDLEVEREEAGRKIAPAFFAERSWL
jgi:hypothetical protein